MDRIKLKEKAIELRKQAKTYSEIQKILKISIPKSTLSYWCKDVKLPKEYYKRIQKIILNNAQKGRAVALVVNRVKREKYLRSVFERSRHLATVLKSKDAAKVALVMLYLGEGSKTRRGSLQFGNSDPFIISLFLRLLRYCYNIDESKFRCTIQCRADQDIKKLEKFWFRVTKIPSPQFYKTRIDSRTAGKPSRKLNYKGVCCIDYFSADVFIELMQIPKIIHNGPIV